MLNQLSKLWGQDPERVWKVARWIVSPGLFATAPGSAGYGLDRVPLEGGAVLAANHLSAIDHPLIGIFSPRSIYYMAKEELMSMPAIGDILRWVGVFPVRRGAVDREALREARRVVREGHVVGVHVEGTRQRLGYPGTVRLGGVMIAMQEGAPILPCAVETFRWGLKNARACVVVWGEPMSLEGLRRNRAGYEEATELVGAEILRLWRLAAEAVAEGRPDRLSDGSRRFLPYLHPWLTDGGAPRPY